MRQWIGLAKTTDTTDVISVFTGYTREQLMASQISGLDILIAALSFTTKGMDVPKYTAQVGPFKLKANSKGVFDIQQESLGQFEDCRQVISKNGDQQGADNIAEMYIKIIAIYLQKIRDGEYSYAKAVEMMPEIYEYPAVEVLSLGSFFFIRCVSLLIGIRPSSPTTPPKKGKKSLKTSSRSSAGTRKSTGSRGR